MRPRTLLILFLAVAGLASFVWFIERDLPGSEERAEQARKVLSFDPDRVVELSYTRGGEQVVLVRDAAAENPSWNLTAPMKARADSAAVERLIRALAGLEKERTFGDGDPSELGLAPPRADLSFEAGGATGRLLVGGEIPAADSMIVATAETGPFHVVAKSLWNELDRDVGDWRSRDVFPGERDQIARLILQRGDERLILARRGDDFFVESPLVDRADEGTVSRFLDALVGLEVGDFVDGVEEPLAATYGLAPAAASLEVITADGMAWHLDLGLAAGGPEGDEEGIYARAGGQIYILADSLGEDLARPLEEWRSLAWSTLQVYEIDRLEISDAAGTVVLEREGADWRRDGGRVEYSPVSDLLYAIVGTKAEALDAGEQGGDPLLTATLNTGEQEQILRLFAPTADRHPATVSGRSTVLWLGGDRVRAIVAKLAAVRAAEVLAEDPAEDGPEVEPEPAAASE
ncbi:MAG: DUF4340 domain-containing protein [Acidobacteria bacterium]|nr:DUF4340 domain-containing protein [Acidobacteriota bacterium]